MLCSMYCVFRAPELTFRGGVLVLALELSDIPDGTRM